MNLCPWCSTGTCKCGARQFLVGGAGCWKCGHAPQQSPAPLFLSLELRRWLAATPPSGAAQHPKRHHRRPAQPAAAAGATGSPTKQHHTPSSKLTKGNGPNASHLRR